jgi:hypothetical protein
MIEMLREQQAKLKCRDFKSAQRLSEEAEKGCTEN